MPSTPTACERAPKIVFWILWLAILAVMSFVRFQLAPETLAQRGDATPMSDAAFLAVLIGPLVLSAIVRVFMIPRQPESGKALVGFVLGLALAEFPTMFASMIEPERAATAYSASVGLWLTYLPALIRVIPNKVQKHGTTHG